MPSLAEIKEAGRAAKAKAREALALEEALSKDADKLWASAFDAVAGPDLREDELPRDCPALIVVPGFASWSALRPEHVEAVLKAAFPRSWPCGGRRRRSI